MTDQLALSASEVERAEEAHAAGDPLTPRQLEVLAAAWEEEREGATGQRLG